MMGDLVDLSAADMAEVNALRGAVGWGAGSWFLEPMLTAGGSILGRRDEAGELAAMGAAGKFGEMGFICNMAVRPRLNRQGLGRGIFEALLSRLRENGFSRIQLEATEEGHPLYRQYGFRVRWESMTAWMTGTVEPGDETGIAPIVEHDWPAIASLDREAYGADRVAFLRSLAAGPYHLEGLRLAENGRLAAFGFRYPGRIGPLVATSPEAGERLARALASRAPAGTFATIGHPQQAALWERVGFETGPFDVRMLSGPEIDDRPEMVVSMLNGGLG